MFMYYVMGITCMLQMLAYLAQGEYLLLGGWSFFLLTWAWSWKLDKSIQKLRDERERILEERAECLDTRAVYLNRRSERLNMLSEQLHCVADAMRESLDRRVVH